MRSRSQALDLTELSKGEKRAPFLRAILDGLIYDGYRFPTEGADGVIGPFTISKAMPLYLRKKGDEGWSVELHDSLGLLAAHLNFKIDIGQLKTTTPLQVNLALLHLTVRRRKCQLMINDDGPTRDTAAESIHMNQNTEWDGRPANLTELVRKLEVEDHVLFSKEDVLAYLTDYEGLTQSYMARAATGLRETIERTIHVNAGAVRVNFDVDASWTGR
jgi:hypothetical protein